MLALGGEDRSGKLSSTRVIGMIAMCRREGIERFQRLIISLCFFQRDATLISRIDRQRLLRILIDQLLPLIGGVLVALGVEIDPANKIERWRGELSGRICGNEPAEH